MDITALVDFTVGVTPIVNLEWIKKIHNDTLNRGYTLEEVKHIIENRLYDYVHHHPSVLNTDVNFQRVPLVRYLQSVCCKEIFRNWPKALSLSASESREAKFSLSDENDRWLLYVETQYYRSAWRKN